MHKISMEGAAYRVIEDIRDYEKLGGMKKRLNDINANIYDESNFGAPKLRRKCIDEIAISWHHRS